MGLRNPGVKYEGSRHNVGAEIVALAGERWGGTIKRAPRTIRADIAEFRIDGVPAVLALPRTFMNESGQAVAPLVRYFGAEPDDLLVIHDDIDLPFGKLRVQFGRGPGGNNGVSSIIRSLRSQDLWRLKCGVGRPPGRMDPADFVLRSFSRTERDEMDLVVQFGADLVETFVRSGGDEARQRAGELRTPD
mgnify:FL=1